MYQTDSQLDLTRLESLDNPQPSADPWASADTETQLDSENWLLGYVDVLTLMLTLVVLLLALHQVEKNQPSTKKNKTPHFVITASKPANKADSTSKSKFKQNKQYSSNKAKLLAESPKLKPLVATNLINKLNKNTAESIIRASTTNSVPTLVIQSNTAEPSLLTGVLEAIDFSIPTEIGIESNAFFVSDTADFLASLIAPSPPAKESTVIVEENISKDLTATSVEQYKQLIAATNMSSFIDISSAENLIRLEVNESILFETGRTDLKSQGRLLLQELAAVFENQPGNIHVEGHTDNIPIATDQFPSNWELSASRASSVARYLITIDISPQRLRAIGFAETRPRASNDTVEGRSMNRRVSLVVSLNDTLSSDDQETKRLPENRQSSQQIINPIDYTET